MEEGDPTGKVPEPVGQPTDPWEAVADVPGLKAAMQRRGIKPLQLESPNVVPVHRDPERAEPEPGLPS